MWGNMKIYTKAKVLNNSSVVGIVLVGDKNQIYMMNGVELQTTDRNSALLYGIKRAISFVKNNKPLYANEDVEIFTLIPNVRKSDFDSFNKKLFEDEYIQKFLQEKNISMKYNQKLLNDFDNQMMLIATHQSNYICYNSFKGYER